MTEYLVRWETYSDAGSPELAAREAFAAAQRPNMSTAVFDVLDGCYGGVVEHAASPLNLIRAKYLVRWEIDAEAETPAGAREDALAAIKRPGTIATVFDVLDGRYGGLVERVDLTFLDTGVEP
jgi:hypothetical protein